MFLLLFQEAMPVIACLEILTPSRFVFQGIVVLLHSSRILCSLRGAVTKGFINTVSRSLWSDSTWTFFPYVHWLNRSRLNKTAKSFFFLCEHISIRLQLKICWYKLQDNHLLVTLYQRLSVRHRNWQLLVFAHHKTLRLGPLIWVRILFIPWKALFCSFDHWNSVSFRRNSLIGSVPVARLGVNFS